jgi:hypothetical protein
MKVSKLASAAAVAVMLAAAPVLLSASDAPKDKAAGRSVSTSKSVAAPASTLATLKAIKAAPMSSSELADVKGLHVHFWNPGAPFGPGPFPANPPHLAGDVKTENNWSDLFGQGDVAPSYHGLCKAAVNGSAIFINPGGGCGF